MPVFIRHGPVKAAPLVTLKVAQRRGADGALSALRNEFQLREHLNSPALLAPQEWIEDHDRAALVCAPFDGHELIEALHDQPWDLGSALHRALEMLEAIACAAP